MDLHPLDGVLPVNEADGFAVVVRLHGTVHDDDVTLVHVRVHHRDTVDAEEESRGAVLNQQLHKVKLLADLLGGRGESCLDGAGEGQLQGDTVSYRMRNHRDKDSKGLCQMMTQGKNSCQISLGRRS